MDHTAFEDRVQAVREAVASAAGRAGRSSDSISILPVTKGFPASILELVAAAGFRAVGENRVDEALGKKVVIDGLRMTVQMIGHLQRNKAAAAAKVFDRIDSVDSLRLARKLESVAEAGGGTMPVLVQVNASGEGSKGGFPVVEAPAAVAEIAGHPHLEIRGLMTMAPFGADESTLRRVFAHTRECLEACRRRIPGLEACELSMGMSEDYEIAIEEGSTQVRLGTALLGERPSWT